MAAVVNGFKLVSGGSLPEVNKGGRPPKLVKFARRGADMVRTAHCSIEQAAHTLFEEYRGRKYHSDEATNKQFLRFVNAIVEDLRNNPKSSGLHVYRELEKLNKKRAKVPHYKREKKKKHAQLMQYIKKELNKLPNIRLENELKALGIAE